MSLDTSATTSFLRSPEWFTSLAKGNAKSQWQPIPHFGWTVAFFVVITIIALPLGGGMFYSSKQNINSIHRYDDFEVRGRRQQSNIERLELIRLPDGHRSEVTFEIDKKMESPVRTQQWRLTTLYYTSMFHSAIDSEPPANAFEDTHVKNRKMQRSVFGSYYKAFVRQEFSAFMSPIPSLFYTAFFFILITAVTLPLAAALFLQTRLNSEVTVRYDQFEEVRNSQTAFAPVANNQERIESLVNSSLDSTLSITTSAVFGINEKLESPVYVYYELENFYQNHKRYVRSLDDYQLGAGDQNAKGNAACDPFRMISQQNGGEAESRKEIINPCGLIAHSYFNDTFVLTSSSDSDDADMDLKMDKHGIATEWDRKYLYGDHQALNFNDNPATRGGKTIKGPIDEDEDFMVWMRVGARPTVRKLYGIIRQDIPKGTKLTFSIDMKYNTYAFDGKKKLILTTANWTGGRNEVTGIVYFVIGTASAVACIIILLTDLATNRDPGDLRKLSWNRSPQ